ncbi:CYTH domain-containing protein [Candidatus Nomurabacteria bacterium]|nr:CYTH domain-containing protein [Candidatus Nomurabacteria bacterium]
MSEIYEIEIKTLLGDAVGAETFRRRLKDHYPDLVLDDTETQLNHYFKTTGNFQMLAKRVAEYLDVQQTAHLNTILEKGSSFSLRTRQSEIAVLLVIKASVDEGTSDNTVSRMEFEAAMPMDLEDLDFLLLETGFEYQAKWSRARETYTAGDMTICLDKNAGYGYLAEFEKVITDGSSIEEVRQSLLTEMQAVGVAELSQDRLERMFAYYNEHWQDYYGTDKTFTIE